MWGRVSERLNGGVLIAALGGVLLLVSLFLDWFEPDVSAWDTFELADLVLAAAGVAAIAGLFRPLVEHRITPDPVRSRGLFFLGLGALIIIVAGLIQPPPAATGRSPEVGAWLGLVGAIVVTAGALLASSRVSITISVAGRGEDDEVVPPPAGTDAAPPDSETGTLPTEPR
jgi:hypothetical protein